jgi:hypothetical protein
LQAAVEQKYFSSGATKTHLQSKLVCMSEHNHERDHEHGHIPPPDLPQHKTIMGFRPHIFIGGLVLIAILLIYLLLLVRPGIYSPAPAAPAPTSSNAPLSGVQPA